MKPQMERGSNADVGQKKSVEISVSFGLPARVEAFSWRVGGDAGGNGKGSRGMAVVCAKLAS